MSTPKRKAFILIRVLRRLGRLVEPTLIRAAGRSSLTSSVYWCFFSKSFRREHHAVALGLAKYASDCRSHSGCRYLLRRNIHRLEKGLTIITARRDIFALDYIGETVECYAKIVKTGKPSREEPDQREIQYAYDILNAYFSAVGAHPVIDHARAAFEQIDSPPRAGDRDLIPYKRDLGTPAPVDYEDLLKLARRRRSVRHYLDKPVPRELLDKAISAAALSPSGCNRQAFEFRVFDDPDAVREVMAIPYGTAEFRENVPIAIVVLGKLRAYAGERDRHMIYIDAGLAAMSLVYALETLGLSSCCVNWPELDDQERELASLLKLEPDERGIMLICAGYPDPDGMVARSEKKGLDLLRRYNLSG